MKKLILVALCLLAGHAGATAPPAFSVQGVLRNGSGALQSMAISGSVKLWDSLTGGTQIGATWPFSSQPVSNGLFTVTIGDAALAGALNSHNAFFLEVTVTGMGTFPRQTVTSELFALEAASADALNCSGCITDSNVAASGISGSHINSAVPWTTGLQSGATQVSLGSTPPTSGQVLEYNGTQWVPTSLGGASGQYVDLVSNQTVGGLKTFTSTLQITGQPGTWTFFVNPPAQAVPQPQAAVFFGAASTNASNHSSSGLYSLSGNSVGQVYPGLITQGGTTTNSGWPGGDGTYSIGGNANANQGGHGGEFFGGSSADGTSYGGDGLRSSGGQNSSSGTGGTGVLCAGGSSTSGVGGVGLQSYGGGGPGGTGMAGVFIGDVTVTGGAQGIALSATAADDPSSPGYGAYFVAGNGTGASTSGGIGLLSYGGASTGGNNGGTGLVGVGGQVPTGQGGFGVQAFGGGSTSGQGGIALYAAVGSGPIAGGQAGLFFGDVQVVGTLSKTAGTFQIDHPLDPANKYLFHSFVESPDMMNIYNGTTVLDGAGQATIQLPDWFEALNRDFRYQLTCIGGFAPVYVAEEVANHRFKIAGGRAGLKVSWQVTGIRHDPYADAHRVRVEVEKPPAERGRYLVPSVYHQPESKAISPAHRAGVPTRPIAAPMRRTQPVSSRPPSSTQPVGLPQP